MATRRRPRTKVYDCNFHIGESYYKPVMDSLDRKYSGRPVEAVTPLADRESTPTSRFSKLLGDREGTPTNRASKLLAEFESNGIDAVKPRKPLVADDDDAAIDAEFEATMKRIKAARAARNAEMEEEFDSFATKKKINIADQLLDSVGLNSKTQRAIEDDVFQKQKRSVKKYLDDEEDSKVMTKWSAVSPGGRALKEAEEAADEMSAVARARKSRARMQDIDAELEELAAKGAARQKRISDLKALMDETSESSTQAASTVKVSKRITVKATSEKKQVTF
ncbi:uncharacterized protein LOC124361224 [Homalodisca vitripennis]|nr:uncharacterized protein LOC124361224 [Homalodisca vitripennis]XP_046671230.1 uncharacterized protein LOC124361224 [Homalodisca vitripennis]KAG8303369.1 hypothetical protein J6590_010403 [Homalodisca vitripennis]